MLGGCLHLCEHGRFTSILLPWLRKPLSSPVRAIGLLEYLKESPSTLHPLLKLSARDSSRMQIYLSLGLPEFPGKEFRGTCELGTSRMSLGISCLGSHLAFRMRYWGEFMPQNLSSAVSHIVKIP